MIRRPPRSTRTDPLPTRRSSDLKTVLFFLVGRKGRAVISRVFPRQTIAQYDTTGIRDIGNDEAQEIAAQVMELFEQGKFDVAPYFYSRFRFARLQEATSRQIIPVAIPADEIGKEHV